MNILFSWVPCGLVVTAKMSSSAFSLLAMLFHHHLPLHRHLDNPQGLLMAETKILNKLQKKTMYDKITFLFILTTGLFDIFEPFHGYNTICRISLPHM